jgi:signal transduction histidine kinase/HPt (histidine-containing phosphotransfer) domain-containing protein
MPLWRDTGTPGAGEAIGSRALLAATAMAIVAAAVPISFIVLPGLRGIIAPPRIGNTLLGLLLLAPAAVGLGVALSGLGRVSNSSAAANHATEQAVLRIIVAALLFGHAVLMAMVSGSGPATSRPLLIGVAGLVVGWLVLLPTLVWPAASVWLRRGTMLFDVALVSAFLHFGGQDAAGWYPLYLLLTAYAGFRFGIGALVGSAALGVLGFGGVAATTEFWQQQPALTAECAIALLLLPILVQGPIRAMVEARGLAAAANIAKTRFVAVLADALRAPLIEVPGPSRAGFAARERPVLPPQVADILDLAAIETGTYAPQAEPFDLHALINDALVAGRAMAESKGIGLRVRIDPYLPYRLRGWRQSVDRILGNLLGHAIEMTEFGTARLHLKVLGSDGAQVRLALAVEGGAESAPRVAAAIADPFAADQGNGQQGRVGLALVKRAAELMGGQVTSDTTPSGHARFTVELTLALDTAAPQAPLVSSGCPVLIVTGNSLFAGNVCEYLGGWDAPVSWIGEAEGALNYIAWLDPATRAVLLVDGGNKPLSAMGLVNRVLTMDGAPPFVLFVADPAQVAALAALEDGEVDAFLPAPLTPQLLVNALHALPLRAAHATEPPAQPEWTVETSATPDGPAPFDDRVTPIAAHPRFAAESNPVVDPRRFEALRELGGQEGFLADLIETFRADAQQIIRRLGRAIATADVAAFAQGLRALGQAAGHVGGTPLTQLTASLRGLGAAELRDQGNIHLQRLEAEIDRLAAALLHYLDQVEAQRP